LIGQGHRTAPQIYKGSELFVEGGYQGLAKLSDEIQIKFFIYSSSCVFI
jgi:hypothetical protein